MISKEDVRNQSATYAVRAAVPSQNYSPKGEYVIHIAISAFEIGF